MKIVTITTLIACLFVSVGAQATTLIPTPIDRQVKDADAIIVGTYRGKTYQVLPSGEVVTVAFFDLEKGAGLNKSQVYHRNNFRVIYPGGEHGGRVVKVNSSPEFVEGEQAVLMLEQRNFGYMIQNLSLGKYTKKKSTTESTVLVSAAFPHHPELGRIPYKHFEELVKERFKEELRPIVFHNPRLEGRQRQEADQKKSSRHPASHSDRMDERKTKVSNSVFWTVLFFSTLSVVAVCRGRKNL